MYYAGEMGFGKMVPVKDTSGRSNLKAPQFGCGWGYETFCSSFHALKTIHRISMEILHMRSLQVVEFQEIHLCAQK